MDKGRTTRIHFVLIVIGTLLYLYSNHHGLFSYVNNVPQIRVREMASFCENTKFYIAFAALVFGHAILWCSSSKNSSISEGQKKNSNS